MKLGDKVSCTAYIKPSRNHYELNGDIMCAIFHTADSAPLEIGDDLPHSCNRYKKIECEFSGIYCGKTTRCTEMVLDLEYEPYSSREFYRIRLHEPKDFAVVYYADNKKRIVPIENCKPEKSGGMMDYE